MTPVKWGVVPLHDWKRNVDGIFRPPEYSTQEKVPNKGQKLSQHLSAFSWSAH